jgi:hypothetical protein
MTCSQELRQQGKPYPRTCSICRLGPCTQKVNEPLPPQEPITTDAIITREDAPEVSEQQSIQDFVDSLVSTAHSEPASIAENMSEEAINAILVAKYGSLQKAAINIDYNASKPEMEKNYEEYKNKESWKTGIVGKKVEFRADDHNALGLFFTVWMGEGTAFGAYVPVEELRKVVEDTGITDFTKLGGLPCYYTDEDRFCRFKGFWKGNRD